MNWIIKFRRPLIIVCALSGISALLLGLVVDDYLEDKKSIQNWEAGLLFSPYIVFAFSFLPLLYVAWFRDIEQSKLLWLRRLFFWLLAAGLLFIVYMMIEFFVI